MAYSTAHAAAAASSPNTRRRVGGAERDGADGTARDGAVGADASAELRAVDRGSVALMYQPRGSWSGSRTVVSLGDRGRPHDGLILTVQSPTTIGM
jgi:hypothetical protein